MSSPDTGTLDDTRLELLYARLETPIYNVVYRWVWNEAEAHDIVQEAFVKLWRMRARVNLATVEPLVYRIAVNLAANRRRSRKLWRWVSMDALRASSDSRASADETLAAEQTRRAVRAAIDGLPEKYRRVITLCELTELSYEQIADSLGIAVGTVGSRRNTALQLLRTKLGPLQDDSRDSVETRSV